LDGQIDGNTITFKCSNPNGRITEIFTGIITGEQINFSWDLRNQDDPEASSSLSSRQFIARRVPKVADRVIETADRARRPPAITFERVLKADQEPQNWLTYSGSLSGRRYTSLSQITHANVKNLELAWFRQAQWVPANGAGPEATPLVAEGILYTVLPLNELVAVDGATGRVLWTYSHMPKKYCCYRVNRGVALHDDKVFMGTADAHLLAIDAYNGRLVWDTTVANSADPTCQAGNFCYQITHAPLVIKDKVIVGTNGGEGKTRGFIAAFDAKTGKEAWRFYTIPGSGETGNETWSGDSWKTGGASVWNTGSYDPDLNLTYWGIGNPSPNENPNVRLGDNLYSDSVVALDADTGKLKWYYQFTPHDESDWDATQIPVLADLEWQGRPRKVMLWANRNGMMYVLDRTTGQFLLGKPFVEVNWLTGFDERGRPLRTPKDTLTSIKPVEEATNWQPPSYSLNTGLFYIAAWEESAKPEYSALRAFDPHTGEKRWEFKKENAKFNSGALTTASDLLFTGVAGRLPAGRVVDGQFYALDARTGEVLWQRSLPGSISSGPISYSVAGKQYIAVAAGDSLVAFALRQ
jgi:alcohol dehydrogenase (cytochrome c)